MSEGSGPVLAPAHDDCARDAFAVGFCGRDVAAGVSNLPDTHAAIALMARVGVPAAVDAFALRRHLDRTLRLHEPVREQRTLFGMAVITLLFGFAIAVASPGPRRRAAMP